MAFFVMQYLCNVTSHFTKHVSGFVSAHKARFHISYMLFLDDPNVDVTLILRSWSCYDNKTKEVENKNLNFI